MRVNLSASVVTFAALSIFVAGCGAPPRAREPVGSARGAVGACNPANSGHDCIHLNGDGVHVGSTDRAGLRAEGAPTWLLLGFMQDAHGLVANGWYEGRGPADARIVGAHIDGRARGLHALRVRGSSVTAALDDGTEIGDTDMARLVITLRVPTHEGSERPVSLRFGEAAPLSGGFDDVLGRTIELRDDSAASPSFTAYCRNESGAPMPAVVTEGVQWSPVDGARTGGTSRAGVACESGAAAACMAWGYRPWASAEGGGTLADHHQACVHLKRAAYFGDARSFTTPGRSIAVRDALTAPLQRGEEGAVEALWTADGAACVNEPRAPEATFAGLARMLPRCDAGDRPKAALLVSTVPGRH